VTRNSRGGCPKVQQRIDGVNGAVLLFITVLHLQARGLGMAISTNLECMGRGSGIGKSLILQGISFGVLQRGCFLVINLPGFGTGWESGSMYELGAYV
jgi:hypothetical protein